MAIEIKIDASRLRKKLDKTKEDIGAAIAKKLEKEVLKEIRGGRSPVRKQGRFQKYSKSYIKQMTTGNLAGIKKPRPVNLTLSGQLLDTIFTTVNNNKVTIGFTDELFDIHNEQGAGKSKVKRRMLPTKPKEKFNRSITLRLKELVRRKIRKIFK